MRRNLHFFAFLVFFTHLSLVSARTQESELVKPVRYMQYRSLLREKQFEQLEARLIEVWNESENVVSRDIIRFGVMGAFEVATDDVTTAIKEWHSVRPSFFTRIALASHYLERLRVVSVWGQKTFEPLVFTKDQLSAEVKKHCRDALELEPKSFVPQGYLISLARYDGLERREAVDAERIVSKHYPENIAVRLRFLKFLEPEQGGSEMEMKSYIESLVPYLKDEKNERVKPLYRYLSFYKASQQQSAGAVLPAHTLVSQSLISGVLPEYLHLQSKTYQMQDKHRQAISILERLLVQFPENPFYKASLLFSHYEQQSGSRSKIERDIPDLIALNPFTEMGEFLGGEFAKDYVRRGFTDFNREIYQEASKQYKKAIELDPLGYSGYYWLGKALVHLRQYSKAQDVIETALRLSPYSVKAASELGKVLMVQGKLDDVIVFWNEFISGAESAKRDEALVGQAYFERARVFEKQKNRKEALSDIQKACAYGWQYACTFKP